MQTLPLLGLEVLLLMLVVAVVSIIAAMEGMSPFLGIGVTLATAIASMLVPHPFIRILGAGVLSVVLLMVIRLVRETIGQGPGPEPRRSRPSRRPRTNKPVPNGMVRCPNCDTVVVETSNRQCPACREKICTADDAAT